MSTSATPVQDAPMPFSGAADSDHSNHPADFILRSSDGVDFHVHKDILKFVSDCFDGMLTIPQGDGDPTDLRRDDKPVLVMPESKAIYRLLCLAYPAHAVSHYTLQSADLDGIVDVYKAAHKYQFTRVQDLLNQMLSNAALVDGQPHRVFAIATLCDLPGLVREAAISVLTSAVGCRPPAFPEMELLTWASAHKLSKFHEKCGLHAEELLTFNKRILSANGFVLDGITFKGHMWNEETNKPFVWWKIEGHSEQCGRDCGKRFTSRGESLRENPVQWFQNQINRVASNIRLCPSADTVEHESWLTVKDLDRDIVKGCPVCSDEWMVDLSRFWRQIGADIKRLNVAAAAKSF
ncbi:BTB domain-containing protein [Mycena venus]|uniref:BTB domain-containing protein n=1 Tax=Mycena venus TaxID=2733690 RepID=A0A8H6XYX1_9AGAR|nr:BTB domain-containing protein [Mycena venus]